MSILRHILIAIGYSVIAAAVALILPRTFAGIDPNTTIMLSAVVLVGSALLHEVFSRQEEEGRLVEEVQDLRAGHGRVMGELSRAREEVGNIYKAIEIDDRQSRRRQGSRRRRRQSHGRGQDAAEPGRKPYRRRRTVVAAG